MDKACEHGHFECKTCDGRRAYCLWVVELCPERLRCGNVLYYQCGGKPEAHWTDREGFSMGYVGRCLWGVVGAHSAPMAVEPDVHDRSEPTAERIQGMWRAIVRQLADQTRAFAAHMDQHFTITEPSSITCISSVVTWEQAEALRPRRATVPGVKFTETPSRRDSAGRLSRIEEHE